MRLRRLQDASTMAPFERLKELLKKPKMDFKVGDEVKIAAGVVYRGTRVGDKVGVIRDIIDDEATLRVPGIWYLLPVLLKSLTKAKKEVGFDMQNTDDYTHQPTD